ncbi:MAG: hypothetical protein A3I61_12760 [Acidobacteria bacterium RIFCSPLOWO2_02_FULL_68_18]|nr:MAG: hypothetical protein A3I61_12760 [Acidobacteria bacterium RIFCSPLOWO2_02_FULL_68_18]OFW47966.1 MAG: hypothetical protein A3G77_07155 [Acidobacteria bacterium RIFCSPLOWO2_12_FULL_68_19]
MRISGDRGYAMAALLVALSVMGIMMGMALPAWRTWMQREREAELVFRGEQYAQAITLFSRRTGGFPTSFDTLRDGRYIRKLYKDPMTNTDFQPVYFGQITTPTPAPTGRGGAAPGRGGAAEPAGRPGQTGSSGFGPGAAASPVAAGRSGQPGQPSAGALGQTPPISAGPIIGVVSRSTNESLRMYNGRTKYNEWLFVSTAATVQAGAPGGGLGPGIAGRGAGPGRGRGVEPAAPGRGGRGRGDTPDGRSPFDRPLPPGRGRGGFQPAPGSPNGPGPNSFNPFTVNPGRATPP